LYFISILHVTVCECHIEIEGYLLTYFYADNSQTSTTDITSSATAMPHLRMMEQCVIATTVS